VLASAVLAALVVLLGVQTPVRAATSSTGAVAGAIFDLTPGAQSSPLPGTVKLITQRGRLAASQRVRAGRTFRLIAPAGRYRLTATTPCSSTTSVVIHQGQTTHHNIASTVCGP
jgi:hypothetical protein